MRKPDTVLKTPKMKHSHVMLLPKTRKITLKIDLEMLQYCQLEDASSKLHFDLGWWILKESPNYSTKEYDNLQSINYIGKDDLL